MPRSPTGEEDDRTIRAAVRKAREQAELIKFQKQQLKEIRSAEKALKTAQKVTQNKENTASMAEQQDMGTPGEVQNTARDTGDEDITPAAIKNALIELTRELREERNHTRELERRLDSLPTPQQTPQTPAAQHQALLDATQQLINTQNARQGRPNNLDNGTQQQQQQAQIPFYFNVADRYPDKYTGKTGEDAKSHFYGFKDYIDNMLKAAPPHSTVRDFDFQLGKFKETLTGSARSWLVHQEFNDMEQLKEAFLERFHKIHTAAQDTIITTTPMKATDNIEEYAARLDRAAHRLKTHPDTKRELLLTNLTPDLRNHALSVKAATFKEIVAACKEYNKYTRNTENTTTPHEHNTTFSIQQEPQSKVDELMTSLSDMICSFNQYQDRGRKREKSPYPGKDKRYDKKHSYTHRSNFNSKSRHDSKGRNEKYRVTFRKSRDNSRERSQSRGSSRHSSRATSRSSSRVSSRDSSYDNGKTRYHQRKSSYTRNICHNCGKVGHFWRKCRKPLREDLSSMQEAELNSLQNYQDHCKNKQQQHFPKHSM